MIVGNGMNMKQTPIETIISFDKKITHIFIFELMAVLISWMQDIGDKKLATQIHQQLWLRSCLISILLGLISQ